MAKIVRIKAAASRTLARTEKNRLNFPFHSKTLPFQSARTAGSVIKVKRLKDCEIQTSVVIPPFFLYFLI